ncbi:MAG: site-specific DNA-methyltransferase [Anaerolineae bacterium]|nr:MAG: site-specific DNA-methyltransferase [Anaerolineae bacterium]
MTTENHLERLINYIHNQDVLDGLRSLPNECADLIIADPPYNLNKNFGIWDEKRVKDEWLSWSKQWLDESKRVLRSGGNIFVYGIHHHLCWLQCHMYEIGLTYRRQIIWYYENGFAGYSARTLAAHYEPLLWFSKGANYTYHPIREPYKSQERLKHKITKNGKVWEPHPDGRLAGDVWNFPTLAGKRFKDEKVNHPTQKPLSISLRIVRHFSNENDLVIVPFAGSGTECLASVMENRQFIGFELNPDYIDIANKRINDWNSTTQITSDSQADRDNLMKD